MTENGKSFIKEDTGVGEVNRSHFLHYDQNSSLPTWVADTFVKPLQVNDM